MVTGMETAVLKKQLLDLLEKDREFRYAVMGLLGMSELLERFTRLEERQQKLEERQQKLEERQQKLEERQQRLEERFARIEERQQKLEERFAKLEERFARLEERQQRLEERQQKLEERFNELMVEVRDLRRVITVIAHRFGVITESAFREAMKYVVEEALGVGEVSRVRLRDDESIVYGHPAEVEVDVVVRDKEHILVEVKSRVSRSDVAELYRLGVLYEKTCGVKPKLVIIGGFIDFSAWDSARTLGVVIKPALKET